MALREHCTEVGSQYGIEVTLSVSSELFNRDIKGFGLIMSGAYTDSSIKPWGPTNADAPIAGLSDKVAGFTVYYERHGFSVIPPSEQPPELSRIVEGERTLGLRTELRVVMQREL